MAVDILSRYITSDPNTFGGKPCIAGRRIRVVDIAIWHEKFGWRENYPSKLSGEQHG